MVHASADFYFFIHSYYHNDDKKYIWFSILIFYPNSKPSRGAYTQLANHAVSRRNLTAQDVLKKLFLRLVFSERLNLKSQIWPFFKGTNDCDWGTFFKDPWFWLGTPPTRHALSIPHSTHYPSQPFLLKKYPKVVLVRILSMPACTVCLLVGESQTWTRHRTLD